MSTSTPKVNLFVIGVQKGGTTALAHFLSQHPEICVAKGKEAHYFDAPSVAVGEEEDFGARYIDKYFPHRKDERYLCDATPVYIYLPDCLPRIRAYNPDARILVVLRDPVARAYSHYRMMKIKGIEHRSFLAAILLEPWRIRLKCRQELDGPLRDFSYLSRGLYARQLDRLWGVFPRDQVLVLKNAELASMHDEVMGRVWCFLGLAPRAVPREIIFSMDDGSGPGVIATAIARIFLWLAHPLRLYPL